MFCIWLAVSLIYTMFSNSYAGYNHETQTIAGLFKIEDIYPPQEYYFNVFLDDKRIYQLDMPYVDIEQKYTFNDKTLLVLHFGYGGAATTPEYVIVDISKKKPPKMSVRFFSKSQVPSFTMKNKRLEIDLGFDSGRKKTAIYQKGKLQIHMQKVTQRIGDERSCRYMYNHMYTSYIKEQKCTLPFAEVFGLASQRYLRAIGHDPRFNLIPLDSLAKEACLSQKKHPYSHFQKLICTMP